MKARQIIEAINPRNFLKQQARKALIPNDEYFVALDKRPLKPGFRDGSNSLEWCPIRLNRDGTWEQLDGMYSLLDDCHKYLGFGEQPTDAQQDQVGALADGYGEQIWAGLRSGQLQGVAKGPLGDRYWQLIFWTGEMGQKAYPAEFGVNPPYAKYMS